MRQRETGKPYLILEALGYYIGTLVDETPFEIHLGPDAVWVRDMGTMGEAMGTGRVNQCFSMPNTDIAQHARRTITPWPHKVPKP